MNLKLHRVGRIALTFAIIALFDPQARTLRADVAVEALFDIDDLARSPFPSDGFTVPDDDQITGLRMNLPPPVDCQAEPYGCKEVELLNELDGFHVQPRIAIPFSGPISSESVTSDTVFLVALDGPPRVVGINQVVCDVATNTLYATADELLEQHARYALVVTKGLRDENDKHVKASKEFLNFVDDSVSESTGDPGLDAYRAVLRSALTELDTHGVVPKGQVVAASAFTTQSVTASLEQIRDQIASGTPEPARFDLGLGGTRTVFRVGDIPDTNGILVTYHTGVSPDTFAAPTAVRSALLKIVPGAVETLAVGSFKTAVYAGADGVVPPVGTRSGEPVALGSNNVYFTAFLPAGVPPEAGWPVVLFGPGQPGDDMWGTPFNVAAMLAAQGLATVSIQSAWHGFGPKSTVTVRQLTESVTFPAGGRNTDRNGDHKIDQAEAVTLPGALAILGSRDAWRQTIADTLQFIQVLKLGVDVDGDSHADFDAAHVSYFGFSAGGWRGVPLVGVEPSVEAAVFHGAGTGEDRLSPTVNRPFLGTVLAAHDPSLINPAGEPLVTAIDGVAVNPPLFNENLPLRDQLPVTNTVAGAIAIQQWIERKAWLGASADPVAFAPYVRREPFTAAGARPVLILFAKGDQTIPNPATAAFLRAGDLADAATVFRNDRAVPLACNLALPAVQQLEKNAHSFVVRMNFPLRTSFALAAQAQVAAFLKEPQLDVLDPDSALALPGTCVPPYPDFFEVGRPGAPLPLPEDLGFIP